MTEKPRVSVIIPSWNRKDELVACLRSIMKQKGVEYEIIVVDDGSTDGTIEELGKNFPVVRVIADGMRCGHIYRRNQGIVASRGELLLHLDSDVELTDENLLSRMVARFDADPKLGELGGEIALNVGDTNIAFGLMVGRLDRAERVFVRKGEPPIECDYLAGLNAMYRRDVAFQVGGYDPYYLFGVEDGDFGLGIKRLGCRNILDYDCAVIHKASTSGRRDDESYRYCLANARFTIKYRGIAVFLARLLWYVFRYATVYLGLVAERETRLAGGRQLLKAYFWYLRHMRFALSARNVNFLDEVEMDKFVAWKKGQ